MKLWCSIILGMALLLSMAVHSPADGDTHAPTKHSLTLSNGDQVEVTVQGLSHLAFTRNSSYWDVSRRPNVWLSLITLKGHYSNKREPYVISGRVVPASGTYGGWYHVNTLGLYLYTNCGLEPQWMNYIWTNALPIWKPEQSGELVVTGSGEYLPQCSVSETRLALMDFQGFNDANSVVRQIYITLEKGLPLPSAPPDEPGDPDFNFNPSYDERTPEPPGEDWPPLSEEMEEEPPYDSDAEGDPEEPKESGGGAGVCSLFGLPTYRVGASDLTLEVSDRMFAYRSIGPDVSLTHTHRSKKANDGMFGSRWFFSYEQQVVPLFSGRVLRGDLTLSSWADPEGIPPAANVHLGRGRATLFLHSGTNAAGEQLYAPLDPSLRAELALLPDAWELRRMNPRWTHRFERAASYLTYPLGRLTSISDPFGNALSFTYKSNTNASERSFWLIQNITDAAGRFTTFEFNTNGLCSRLNTPNGLFATYAYDTNACLIQTTDLLGNVTDYTYNDTVQTLDRIDSAGKTIRFAYDEYRRLSSLTDPHGRTNSYSVPYSNITRFVSAAGYPNDVVFNESGLPVAQSNAAGQTAAMQYDANNRPIRVVRTGNRIVTLEYDAAGNCVRRENPTGTETTRTFDQRNRLTTVTNTLGQALRFTYSPFDQLLSVTRPSGARVTYGYLPNGRLATITNEIGTVTRFQYDAFGNISRLTDPAGGVTAYRFDPSGLRVTNIVNPNGHATAYAYDANGRMTNVCFADATTQTFHYDCCALTGITDPFGRHIAIARDANLYITNFTDTAGSSTVFSYDPDGRQTAISNTSGYAHSAQFDELGRPRDLLTPAGTLRFAYNEFWNIATITNPAGNAWNYTYNNARRLTAETDPLGRTTTYTRDPLGRLTAVTNADGTVVIQTYTPDGYPDTLIVGSHTYHIEYNDAGWVTAQQNPLGTDSFSYDSAGRVTRIDYPGGLAIQKTYDPCGNLTSLVYPNGITTTNRFDTRERLLNTTWEHGSVAFAYDAASRLTTIIRSNGVHTALQRNLHGQVTTLVHNARSGPPVARIELMRDALGRVLRSTIQTTNLPPADPSGEPSAAMTYAVDDGLSTLAGAAVQSDLNGNIIAIPSIGCTYSYDALNRVTTLTTPKGTTHIAYDSLNRVIRLQNPEKTRRFFYDERSRLLFATDDVLHLVWINLYAGNLLLAREGPSLGIRYYLYSDLGHTLAQTDSDGAVTDAFAYTPFGMSTQAWQTEREWFTLSGSFTVLELGSGHYHMRHRLYHAGLGRFLQRDPIGLAAGANLYAYVGADPANAIDPFGLSGYLYEETEMLREEYNSQRERENKQEFWREKIEGWDQEDRDRTEWNKQNPVKAWTRDLVLDKALSFCTGGFSDLASLYDSYQSGQYFDIALNEFLGRYDGLNEARGLIENLWDSYGSDYRDITPPPPGGGISTDGENLGGAGGPQCMMESAMDM